MERVMTVAAAGEKRTKKFATVRRMLLVRAIADMYGLSLAIM